MRASWIIICCNIVMASALTCNEILESQDSTNWTVMQLQSVPPKDLIECLPHLGKEKLRTPETQLIWSIIVKYYEGVPNVPENVLMQLRWVTVAVQPEHIYNMTLNNIDVIGNFGLDYNLKEEQLSALADRVREDWGGKEPEDYSFYDLTALRQILCAFNRSEIERINTEAYKEAAVVLGKLSNCSPDVLQGFATLAVQKKAFGSPSNWNKAQTDALGVVADYVQGIKSKNNRKEGVRINN